MTNRVAVITGGSSGLGLALAHELGAQGYAIVVLARNEARNADAVTSLREKGVRADAVSADVTDEAALRRAAAFVEKEHGGVDFLILNAGAVSTTLVADYPNAQALGRDLQVDLWGTILCTYVFLPLVRREGRILMISSGFGLVGAAGYAVYGAAKAGIVTFAEALRRELLGRGTRVYVACPGDMHTPQFEEEVKNMPEWMRAPTPRMAMSPDTAAKRILRRCRGKRRFLIFSSFDVFALAVLSRLLPRTWRDAALDAIFPRPPSQ